MENGYYWVRHNDKWIIVSYSNGFFYFTGNETAYTAAEFPQFMQTATAVEEPL